jgi:cell division protein FtsI/penicillin-binding protein 2
MDDACSYRRVLGLGGMLALGFAGLGGWLGWLQLQQHERLRKIAEANLEQKVLRPPRRGDILDASGNPLATSEPVKTVCADPSLMGGQYPLVARTLAPLLQLKEPELQQQLRPRLVTNANHKPVTNAYVVLKRKVPLTQWQQVTQAMAQLHGGVDLNRLALRERQALKALRHRSVFGEDSFVRRYPNGRLAAHVLGYVATQAGETDYGQLLEIHGWDGVELVFDKQLAGVPGWRRRCEDVAPRAGLNVVLTLDASVQNILESELDKALQKHGPASAMAIVIRPPTGEVLGLAVAPGFDPNWPAAYPEFNRRNRAISDPLEPGSTFKVVVISGALDAGLVTLCDGVDCEHGRFLYGGRVLRDHATYDWLTVAQVLYKSSNIGAAKVGLKLGPARLYHYITSFGFGAASGILLPGESRGMLRPVARWERLSVTRLSIGHELLVTPLQMGMAVAGIANEGRLMLPLLVDRLEDEQGRVVWKNQPTVVRQVISPAAARQTIEAMKAVASPEGTAPKAKLEHFTVAGKTGTAQKCVNGAYDSGRYVSSFFGFFPADHPQLCIGIVLDDPDPKRGYYGGEVVGPIFKAMAEQIANYLRLPPELTPEPRPEPQLQPREQPLPELTRRNTYAAKGTKNPATLAANRRAFD